MRKLIAWILLLVSLLQCFAFAETAEIQFNAQQISSTNHRTAVRTAQEVYLVLPGDDGELLVRVPLAGGDPALVCSADNIEDLLAFNGGVAYLKTEAGVTTIESCSGSKVSTLYSFGSSAVEKLSEYGGKLLVLMGGLLHSVEPNTALCLKLSGASMLDYVIGNGYAYFIAGGDQIEYTAQLDSDTTIAAQAGCLYRLNLNSGETELMLKSGVVNLDIMDHTLFFHNLADAYAVRTSDETTLMGRIYSLDAEMMTLENECKQPDTGFWPLKKGLVAWYDGALNMTTETGAQTLYTPEAGAYVFSDGEMLYIWEPEKETLTEVQDNGDATVIYTGDLAKAAPAPSATPTVAPTATPEPVIDPVDLDTEASPEWFENFMENASTATGNSYVAPTKSSSVTAKPTPIGQATPEPAATFPPAGIASASKPSSGSSSSSSSSNKGNSSSSSSSSGGSVSVSGDTVKATGNVYIRSKPNKSSKALGSMPKGATGPYQGSAQKDSRGVVWYKVKYNGITGWVSSRYSKVQYGGSSSGGSSSSGGGSVSVSGDTVKATGNVNIRSNPDKTSQSLGSMAKGATGTYLGAAQKDSRGVVWYKVKYNGVTGWVSSKYSKVQNGGGSSGGSSSSSGTSVKTTGSVNIRSNPDKTSASLGTIASGKTLSYLGQTSTDSRGVKWYKISYKGVTGWVSSKYSKLQ